MADPEYTSAELTNGLKIYVIRDGIRKYAQVQDPTTGEIVYTGPTYNNTPSNPVSDKRVLYAAADYMGKYYRTSLDLKFGTLTLNERSPSAPLLVVYGGIPVGGELADKYMQYFVYVNGIKNNYSTWIAKSNPNTKGQLVKGNESYNELNLALQNNNIIPSKRILYLFSGGYNEGKSILKAGLGGDFDEFYLVDIWIGSSDAVNPYISLAESNKNKVFYFYASGWGSETNKDKLIKAVGPGNSINCKNNILLEGEADPKTKRMNGHMKSNIVAINTIINSTPTKSSISNTKPSTTTTPPQATPGIISTGEGISPDISFAKKIAIQNASKNYSGSYDIVDEQLFQLSDGTYKWVVKIQYN